MFSRNKEAKAILVSLRCYEEVWCDNQAEVGLPRRGEEADQMHSLVRQRVRIATVSSGEEQEIGPLTKNAGNSPPHTGVWDAILFLDKSGIKTLELPRVDLPRVDPTSEHGTFDTMKWWH
jgi:hypothetical protein